MQCKLCGYTYMYITYKGQIRDGGLDCYTENEVEVYKCPQCGVIWHEPLHESKTYYETAEYRGAVDLSAEVENYYRLHDKECLDKLNYTGTNIFRNKVVADIGCGGGSFLDFLNGVAKSIVAIEPSEMFRCALCEKNYATYAYTKDALKDYVNQVDIVTSFDVIEHVTNPLEFLKDAYNLLGNRGKVIIGTPTEAPVMRELLGKIYEKKVLFTTQHIWIFSENALKEMAQKVGFRNITVRYFQRYGINNMLGWLMSEAPNSSKNLSFVGKTFDAVWKGQMEDNKYADYILLYAEK